MDSNTLQAGQHLEEYYLDALEMKKCQESPAYFYNKYCKHPDAPEITDEQITAMRQASPLKFRRRYSDYPVTPSEAIKPKRQRITGYRELSAEEFRNYYWAAREKIRVGRYKHICTALQGTMIEREGVRIPLGLIEQVFPHIQQHLPIENRNRVEVLSEIINQLN